MAAGSDNGEVRVAKHLGQAYKSPMSPGLQAFALTISGLILLSGCGHAVPPNRFAYADSQTITFLATDYRFEGPEIVQAGDTIVRLSNQGHEAHHVQLVKLDRDRTPKELIEALGGPVTQIPDWARQIGGPNAVGSGRDGEAFVHLEPGRYVVLCLIPTKEGTVHAVIGMQKPLEVVGGSASAVIGLSGIPSDYHLAMADYGFTMLEEVAPGRHTFRVVNRGSHVHEASLIRLAPQATVEDVLAAFAVGATQALPGTFVGGVTGLEPGGESVFTATLSPGRYGLFCLFPNPNHETSHLRRGMAMTFMVE